MSLRVAPITIGAARAFVDDAHSHHFAPQGAIFAVSVAEGERVCCVALVGRPVSRVIATGRVSAEVTRVASDGTRHAASMCIAAATRAPLSLGYRRVVSYTLLGEAGTSHLAAGWHISGLSKGGEWSRASRPRSDAAQSAPKARWETGPDALPPDGAAALVVGMCVGRIELRERPAPQHIPLPLVIA